MGTIFGVAGGVGLLSIIFLLPFIYVRLVREDWKLKQWDIIKGPLLLRRPDAGPIPAGHQLVPDYYAGHKTREELDSEGRDTNSPNRPSSDEESRSKTAVDGADGIASTDDEKNATRYGSTAAVGTAVASSAVATPAPVQRKWYEPAQLWTTVKWTFFRGVMIDIVAEQTEGSTNEPKFIQRLLVGKNLKDKHARVKHYDPKVEHLFSFLQVMTAATASFAHGANDVSNAMGPLSAIYHIWQTNETGEDSPVPIWILVFGGAAISIGLWT